MLVMRTAAAKHPAHLLITCTFIFPSSHRSGEATLTVFAAPRDLTSEVTTWLPLKQLEIALWELDKRDNFPHVQIFTASTLCDCNVWAKCSFVAWEKENLKRAKTANAVFFSPEEERWSVSGAVFTASYFVLCHRRWSGWPSHLCRSPRATYS